MPGNPTIIVVNAEVVLVNNSICNIFKQIYNTVAYPNLLIINDNIKLIYIFNFNLLLNIPTINPYNDKSTIITGNINIGGILSNICDNVGTIIPKKYPALGPNINPATIIGKYIGNSTVPGIPIACPLIYGNINPIAKNNPISVIYLVLFIKYSLSFYIYS